MSQLHTCPGPVASSTGASRGVRLLLARRVGATGRADWSSIPAAIRHHERREAEHHPVVPGGRERVVDRDALLPAGGDPSLAIAARSAGPIRDG